MFEICEYKRTFGLILVTVVLVLEWAQPTVADLDDLHNNLIVDKLAWLSDKFPNKIPWLDWNLNDRRPWRIALTMIAVPKMIYHRLKRKYKKQIQRNKRNQRKYRTIVPVSIVPSIIAAARYNRERHSEYYIVGANALVEPKQVPMSNETPKSELKEIKNGLIEKYKEKEVKKKLPWVKHLL